MEKDIVERLRFLDGRFDISPDLHAEAADEIERLRTALKAIAYLDKLGKADFMDDAV